MPPERSVDHDTVSMLSGVPATFSMIGELLRRQILVPAQLLQNAHRELGIAVLDFRTGQI